MHFLIHNGARDVATRNTRAQRPAHGGLKQYIMNGTRRLVRGRPVLVNEEQLKQHIEELRGLAKEGVLYVTRTDGSKVNLHDDAFPASPAAPPANPTPNPPLDDANKDTPHGAPLGTFPGEAPPPKDFTMPVDAPPAATENNPLAPSQAETPVEGVPAVGGGLDLSSVIGSNEPEPVSAEVAPETPVSPIVEVKGEESAPEAAPTAEVPAAEDTPAETPVEVTEAETHAAEEAAAGTEVTEPATTTEESAEEVAPAADTGSAPVDTSKSSKKGKKGR